MKSPLVFAIEEIPETGMLVKLTFPPEWLGDSLLAAYKAEAPVTLRLDVRRFGDNIHVDGEVSTTLGFQCSRTLAPGRVDLRVPLGELFQPGHAHKLNLGAGVESEELEGDEPFYYEGDSVDFEPFIREQIVLAQDPYPRLEDGPEDSGPAWTNAGDSVDPRWSKLRLVKVDKDSQ
jgi:uncharacterized metal-binding protein YceD (DUF177 family)